jgi:hypothetical protein
MLPALHPDTDHNFATSRVCRVPMHLRTEQVIHSGCKGCTGGTNDNICTQ